MEHILRVPDYQNFSRICVMWLSIMGVKRTFYHQSLLFRDKEDTFSSLLQHQNHIFKHIKKSFRSLFQRLFFLEGLAENSVQE
jgi:hypothetical protein